MSEYIIEIPDEYFASYDTERDMYYPDERDSAMPITPIVRCRDCRKCVVGWCLRFRDIVKPDGFCSWGERKSELDLIKEGIEYAKATCPNTMKLLEDE